MKKCLSVVISLAVLLVFSACGTSTNVKSSSFVDTPKNIQGSDLDISSSDNVSSENLPHFCYSQEGIYSDSNFDRLCDVCGSDLAHYCNDANGDGQCDKCCASFGIAHQDTTGDGYCDIHKKCKTYLLDHDCCDKNTDHQCDLCYLPF